MEGNISPVSCVTTVCCNYYDCAPFCRSVEPFSRLSVRVFNHNSLKKDGLIGETSIDIYDILKKNNGVINNLSFPLTLKLSSLHTQKSILSNRGPNLIQVLLDGVSVDMGSIPTREASTQEATNSPVPPASLDHQTQPSTSNADLNAANEITSSLPRWSLNDPFSASPNNLESSQRNSADAPKSPANKASNGTTANQQSTSGTTATTSNQQPTNRPSAPQVEEQLPSGWEIRFDTYGR